MKESSPLKKWLYENSWNLIITFVGLVTLASLVRGEVKANSLSIYSLQKQVNRYPSEDYFEEKFRVIEKTLDDLSEKVEGNSRK